MNYLAHFGGASSPLGLAVRAELANIGSSLSPTNIVARAQTMTCAGCHQLSNNAPLGGGLVWPPSLTFTHVTERQIEQVAGSQRYVISPALVLNFLPHRKLIMESFLTGSPLPIVRPGLPIGGRAVH
ncbi:MAG: hypothetical protein RLZZ450_3941 [Pseudomonadota bacterium]|jgi:hypothetical protein